MNEKYRVVLTCWEYQKPLEPFADHIDGFFDSLASAKQAVSESVADELKTYNKGRRPVAVRDSDGEIVCYDYDFRADEDGDHDCCVRFWDGDDYQNVTHYDVYPLQPHPAANQCAGCAYDYFSRVR